MNHDQYTQTTYENEVKALQLQREWPHYHKPVGKGVVTLDIYRMIDICEIDHPALQHAFKKIAAAGKRGAKDAKKDIQEAIVSLQRWQMMTSEDEVSAHQTLPGAATAPMPAPMPVVGAAWVPPQPPSIPPPSLTDGWKPGDSRVGKLGDTKNRDSHQP